MVKLIDAYPGDDPEALAMSGYELTLYDRNPQMFVPNVMTAPLDHSPPRLM